MDFADWALNRGTDLLNAGIRAQVDNPFALEQQRATLFGPDGTPYTEGQPTPGKVAGIKTSYLVAGGLAVALLLFVALKD